MSRAVLHARETAGEPPREELTGVYEAASYLDPATIPAKEPMGWFLNAQATSNNSRYAADIVRFMPTFRGIRFAARSARIIGRLHKTAWMASAAVPVVMHLSPGNEPGKTVFRDRFTSNQNQLIIALN
ncbi:hypothetical protein MKK88_09470 [Methylobacterium sp. E-005]|uniref:hypothetical protein n=1 Tax=Methylobacterium sp. E-005 TaxID=2836549 RepID=UPI001FB90561|nr:hypothetical protein [Methylobacterium sp. E-005]MCJ2086222.1 hypothetical protein [Methylobacterium sp. E-005]